ncbi:MAG: PASTA domain-containing protein [Clostridia bacterium]|nr:PASTA domain-containing protein [Clostridia bacterium]
MENTNRCLSCMQPLTEKDETCPRCNYPVNRKNPAGYLAAKTVLSEHYLVGRALGTYGDACIYIGYDLLLKSPVFIREYFPETLSRRLEDGTVVPAEGKEDDFNACRDSFYANVRAIAKMKDLPSILPLYDIFTEKDTVYAIYDYCEGRSLSRTLKTRGGRMSWTEVRPLFMQLMTTVSTLHRAGIYHLAISPDTILVAPDGKLRLRSFAIPEARTTGSPLKPHLSAGYSAPEQYVAGRTCGAQADVYGLAATIFYTLTGTTPPEAPRRVRGSQDLFLPADVAEELPESVGMALFNALQPDLEKRLGSVEDLRAALSAEPAVNALLEDQEEAEISPEDKKKSRYPLYIGIAVFAVLAVLAGIVLTILFPGKEPQGDLSDDLPPVTTTTAPTTAPTYLDPSTVFAVPNLLGEDYYTKKNESIAGEFKLEISYMKYDEKQERGTILSQEPKAGESAEPGTTIRVVISLGSEKLVVPNVTEWPEEYATKYLKALGFNVESLPVNVSKFDKGLVDGTDPVAGTELLMGDTVTLRVSNVELPEETDTTETD